MIIKIIVMYNEGCRGGGARRHLAMAEACVVPPDEGVVCWKGFRI